MLNQKPNDVRNPPQEIFYQWGNSSININTPARERSFRPFRRGGVDRARRLVGRATVPPPARIRRVCDLSRSSRRERSISTPARERARFRPFRRGGVDRARRLVGRATDPPPGIIGRALRCQNDCRRPHTRVCELSFTPLGESAQHPRESARFDRFAVAASTERVGWWTERRFHHRTSLGEPPDSNILAPSLYTRVLKLGCAPGSRTQQITRRRLR